MACLRTVWCCQYENCHTKGQYEWLLSFLIYVKVNLSRQFPYTPFPLRMTTFDSPFLRFPCSWFCSAVWVVLVIFILQCCLCFRDNTQNDKRITLFWMKHIASIIVTFQAKLLTLLAAVVFKFRLTVVVGYFAWIWLVHACNILQILAGLSALLIILLIHILINFSTFLNFQRFESSQHGLVSNQTHRCWYLSLTLLLCRTLATSTCVLGYLYLTLRVLHCIAMF